MKTSTTSERRKNCTSTAKFLLPKHYQDFEVRGKLLSYQQEPYFAYVPWFADAALDFSAIESEGLSNLSGDERELSMVTLDR